MFTPMLATSGNFSPPSGNLTSPSLSKLSMLAQVIFFALVLGFLVAVTKFASYRASRRLQAQAFGTPSYPQAGKLVTLVGRMAAATETRSLDRDSSCVLSQVVNVSGYGPEMRGDGLALRTDSGETVSLVASDLHLLLGSRQLRVGLSARRFFRKRSWLPEAVSATADRVGAIHTLGRGDRVRVLGYTDLVASSEGMPYRQGASLWAISRGPVVIAYLGHPVKRRHLSFRWLFLVSFFSLLFVGLVAPLVLEKLSAFEFENSLAALQSGREGTSAFRRGRWISKLHPVAFLWAQTVKKDEGSYLGRALKTFIKMDGDDDVPHFTPEARNAWLLFFFREIPKVDAGDDAQGLRSLLEQHLIHVGREDLVVSMAQAHPGGSYRVNRANAYLLFGDSAAAAKLFKREERTSSDPSISPMDTEAMRLRLSGWGRPLFLCMEHRYKEALSLFDAHFAFWKKERRSRGDLSGSMYGDYLYSEFLRRYASCTQLARQSGYAVDDKANRVVVETLSGSRALWADARARYYGLMFIERTRIVRFIDRTRIIRSIIERIGSIRGCVDESLPMYWKSISPDADPIPDRILSAFEAMLNVGNPWIGCRLALLSGPMLRSGDIPRSSRVGFLSEGRLESISLLLARVPKRVSLARRRGIPLKIFAARVSSAIEMAIDARLRLALQLALRLDRRALRHLQMARELLKVHNKRVGKMFRTTRRRLIDRIAGRFIQRGPKMDRVFLGVLSSLKRRPKGPVLWIDEFRRWTRIIAAKEVLLMDTKVERERLVRLRRLFDATSPILRDALRGRINDYRL